MLLDKSDNEPVIAASVELLTAKDSAFVAGDISNNNGVFSFKNLSKGNYILKTTYLGYLTLTKSITLSENQTSVDVGKLYLQTNDILLKETVVEGKRPEVIVKNDTIEYDAASYKTTENAVVEDLLKKLPGVEVDKDGKVTVNGKEIKKFMVDGKEFFSDDPQIASKNLPANMVDKLQVVDRKSDMARMTGFDDGEEETIINLTIRAGMKQGTMGNALAGAGADLNSDHDVRYQAAAFVNHMQNNDRYTLILGTNNNNNMGAADLGANQFGGMRMRRGGGGGGGIAETNNFMFSMNKELSSAWSLNGDIRYNGSDRLSLSNVEQATLSEFKSQLDKTDTRTNYKSNNLSANFKLEWNPDSINTLTIRPALAYNNSHSNEREILNRLNYNTLDSLYNSLSESKNQGAGYNFGATLDYSHRFSKPGRVFSINARGSLNKSYSYEDSWTDYTEYIDYANIYDIKQRSENDDRTGNYRATFSLVEPLGKNNFLQALYRVSYYDTKSVNSTYDLQDWDAPDRAYLNDSLSRSTLRNSFEQRFGLSFKAVRAKYNYTVGFNIDPTRSVNETYQPSKQNIFDLPYQYDSRLANLMGDSLISSIPQNVINFSPIVNFVYNFGQRTNLRIDYEGETNQPSSSQLRDYVDQTRPTDWTKGNPKLKPGYANTFRIRYSKYVPETQLMYNINLNANLSVNDIAAVTQLMDSVRLTTYENINGNWNTQLRGMFNMPLKNKKFTVGSFVRVSYNNQNSFVDEGAGKSDNTQKSLTLSDNSQINYRSDLFDIGANFSINYNTVANSIRPQNDRETFTWGVGGYTTWYLPNHFTLESDINWTKRNGYEAQFNIPETMWNMAVTKQLFNKKFGTGSLKLQIYDILQDRNNINFSSTTNGYRTTEVNMIPSYFMCSFIYKFTIFPKSSSATEDDLRGGMRWGGPGPGGPPPGQ